MSPDAYIEMAETEARHWWFKGRRAILGTIIARMGLPDGARILEVGCGTGGNLEMLAHFGRLDAMELDDTARAIATEKSVGGVEIRPGRCPDAIAFAEEKFDLICLFDVLEHIDQDTDTLVGLRSMLTADGRILITVPAYQWMYGAHDEFLHHKRRYSARELRQKIAAADLQPVRLSYFNTFLFPLAAAVRLVERIFQQDTAAGNKIPNPVVNSLLGTVFAAERFVLPRVRLPFGVSLMCILRA